MATRPDPDVDDDFSEIYEYTGPPSSTVNNAHDREKVNKRSLVDYDEEEETPDPNAVPTDFTSREAKFWEAKSKATERNWKKRKEEEIICKICGESGHFTQWSEELQKLDFQELVMFLQHLPTENWTHQELEMVLSRAFMGHSMFNNSPSHLAS